MSFDLLRNDVFPRLMPSDHWVAGSNPLRAMFHHQLRLIVPCACLAQFSLNNVHKGGLNNIISFSQG